MSPQKPLFTEHAGVKRSVSLHAQAALNALVILGGVATTQQILDRLEDAGLAFRYRRAVLSHTAPATFSAALDKMLDHKFVTKLEEPEWTAGPARWQWTITNAGRRQVADWHTIFYNLAVFS